MLAGKLILQQFFKGLGLKKAAIVLSWLFFCT